MSKLLKFFLIVFTLVSMVSNVLYAQKKQPQNYQNFDKNLFHFGFSLGVNSGRFVVKPSNNFLATDSISSIVAGTSPGFHLGIVTNLHFSKYFDLRFIPSLVFVNRELTYTFSHTSATGSPLSETLTKQVQSIFADFPLELKYKSRRINNYQMYVMIGLKYSIDKASRKDDRASEDRTPVKLQVYDYGYEIGFGMDFYLDFTKVSPEIKMFNGLKNILLQDNTIYSKPIDKLFSKILTLSVTFEG